MASNESAVHPLVGIWEYEKCENFDEFLKSQNMNYLTRKMAIKSKPTITIENTDKNWKIKTKINKMMSLEFTCKEEEEFMDKTPIGDATLNVISRDGQNKIIQKSKSFDSSTWQNTFIREAKGNQMILTLQCGDVISKRYFKRTSG